MDKHQKTEFEKEVRQVRQQVDLKFLNSFENKWGDLDDHYRTFIHFLLKYKYIDNWEREVNENYLPLSYETLKKKIPSEYKIIYEDRFILLTYNNK
jgi:6-pyruvoyl-tetrahydropterin synthase